MSHFNRYNKILPCKQPANLDSFNQVLAIPPFPKKGKRVTQSYMRQVLAKDGKGGSNESLEPEYSISIASDSPEISAEKYFNASLIRDYFSCQELFIASQAPLKKELDKFWHLIWTHDVKTIFCLTKLQENNKKHADKYWACDDQIVETESYSISLLSKTKKGFYLTRVLKVSHKEL